MMTVLDASMYQRITALAWENPHTAEIRRLTGDPLVCVAWDANAGRWLLGRKIRQLVKRTFGLREALDVVEVPSIIQAWELDDVPLLMDERRVAEHLKACDTWNEQRHAADVAELNAREESEARAKRGDTEARARELRPYIARVLSDGGYIAHRSTGPAAGIVSSASLWRRGAGAA